MPRPSNLLATLIGDVVASRAQPDRRAGQQRVDEALRRAHERHPWIHPATTTAGDEFEATYAGVGAAIGAAMTVRLDLLDEVDLRFGIGFGEVTILGERTPSQDGPAWWSAREAIEDVAARGKRSATRTARMAYRSSDPSAPPPAAIDPALACVDALVGTLDPRSLRLLRGLVDGRSQRELALAEGISTSAVSQRVRADSLTVVTDALQQLTTL